MRHAGDGNGSVNGRRSKATASSDRRVALSVDEARILLEACRMYRHSLPVYLLSCRPDFRLITRVIRKLS